MPPLIDFSKHQIVEMMVEGIKRREQDDKAAGDLIWCTHRTLSDMHDGEECKASGGDGCLACVCQEWLGDAYKMVTGLEMPSAPPPIAANAGSEALRRLLVDCDSELSAIAHGRPPSDKATLLDMSHRCRQYYQ